MLTSGTIIGNIVVNGEATASITITVPSAMFTFSPEAINEATTETHFTIDMLTHPDDFDSARADLSCYIDIIDADLIEDDGHYYIDITARDYEGENRVGTVTFTYHDVDNTTVLFTKTFTIALAVPPPEMFTFSPESINEQSTLNHFRIDMLTHPDNFDINRVGFDGFEGDVTSAALKYTYIVGPYYIRIVVTDYSGNSRYGSFRFNYYDVDRTTVLFTKTFTVSLPSPDAMFTFSPESINEETTANTFEINMLTHPDYFDQSLASFAWDGDIEEARLDIRIPDETYYIYIVASSFDDAPREGTVRFIYRDINETVLFTKTFEVSLPYSP